MSKPGLSIESAASIVLRDTIMQHMQIFGHVIRFDKVAGQSVASAYIDGLAGALAFIIAGRHGGSKDDVLDEAVQKLREALDRDLQHLGRPLQ